MEKKNDHPCYDIKLHIRSDELSLIMKKISELPYRGVAHIIQDIIKQTDEQDKNK